MENNYLTSINLIESGQESLNSNTSNHIEKSTIEKEIKPCSGWLILAFLVISYIGCYILYLLSSYLSLSYVVPIVFLNIILNIIFLTGLFSRDSKEVVILKFCGKYRGTVKKTGFYWVFPLIIRKVVSMESRNSNIDKLIFNDKLGNTIEIGIFIVWRVTNAAKALFDVDDYNKFVISNSESALKRLACSYPYNKADENQLSLKIDTSIIMHLLKRELQAIFDKAGIEVKETGVTNLALIHKITHSRSKREQGDVASFSEEKSEEHIRNIGNY